jgi:hypothetical protein
MDHLIDKFKVREKYQTVLLRQSQQRTGEVCALPISGAFSTKIPTKLALTAEGGNDHLVCTN